MGFAGTGGARGRASQAVLHFAVAALSALLAVVLAGLVVVEVQPSWLAGLRNAVPTSPPARSLRPGRLTPPPGSPSASPGSPTAGTGAPATLVGGPGAPVLAAIRPATARPGTEVTLTGANLFSPDGSVLARFGKVPARTRCPTERRCTVVVPKAPAGTTGVRVRVRTAAGVSNALAFAYP